MTVSLSRRRFLALSGASGAALAADPAENAFAARPRIQWQARISADMPEPELGELLLSRLAFGAAGSMRGWLQQRPRLEGRFGKTRTFGNDTYDHALEPIASGF